MVGVDHAGGFADGSVGWLMEGDRGRLRSCRRALQELKKPPFAVEAIGNVLGNDFDLIIQRGDERREISLSRRRHDLVSRPFDLFLC